MNIITETYLQQSSKNPAYLPISSQMNNSIREMVKDKMKNFKQLGLSCHQQVLISLPSLFNYENDQQLASITGINKFIEIVINKTFQALQKFKICVDYTLTTQILSTVWPFFIRPDPTKFIEHLKYLSTRLNLSAKHVCFMIHYSNKSQNKYPAFCIKNTLQHFQVPQEQIKYDLLINVVVGQQCIDALLNITKFNIHKQIVSSQQNEFIQQELKPSAMTSILQKLLSHKINVVRFIRQIKDEYVLVRYLDQWLKLSSNDYLLNIFRALKIILVCESLYQIRFQQQSENVKLRQPIMKIINQVSHRFLNRLFNRNLKQKILILDWILQGKVWSQNQQLKNSLIPYLITCFELHKYKEQSQIKLVQKVQREETKLLSKYLLKIKHKYFGPINFRLKVPKYYLKLSLGLVEQESIQTLESKNSILKNTSGTVSLSKIGGGQSINLQYQNQKLTKCSFDKLIVSVFKYTQNIQLHIVYIILQVLQQEMKMNPKQLKQSQTDTQKTKSEQKNRPKPNNFMKLFYRVIKSIKQYTQIFEHNKLTQQINKIISSFAIYFQFGTIRQLHRTDLHDLQMIVNNDVALQNLAANLLRNARYHALSTIYSVEVAQNIMNAKSISQTNNSNRMLSNKKNKKQLIQCKLDNSNSQKSMFINTLGEMIQLFTKKQQEIQFLSKIALISDIKITQTLFLNLFYYLVLRTSRNSANQKEKKKKIAQLQNIIQRLFKTYFENNTQSQQANNIVKILATAHKIFENWRKSTRKSCSFNENQLNSLVPEIHQQQKSISQCYWRFMISNSSKSSNIMYAKHFQKANCIKESIYWMQMRHRYQFPLKSSVEQTQWLYNLHSRLADHLSQCKPYVYNKLGKDSSQKQRMQIQRQKKNKNELKWFEQIKFLTNNLTQESYSSIVYNNCIKIWQFQQTEEVDQTLHQIFVFCTYFQSIKCQNYSNLYTNMLKLNNRDICLSIINCLNINKQIILNRQLDKKRQQQKQCQILSIIYNQKLRYNQLDDLQAQLYHINVENMNVQQVRAAIILYSKIQQFDKVRLLFRYLRDCPPRYKQELEFYNMQAIYKSTMMYPAEKMIQNLQKIIRYIEEQNRPQKLTKSSTNPLFQSFKFICENYQHLTLEQEKKIVSYLNRYLKKVYECQNYALSTEAAYFILRFILIQSTNSTKLSSINSIFPYQKYGASILQPHKQLLICSIGESAEKNNFIKKILVRIAENDPKASSWWLYGLKYHCDVPDKKGKQYINAVDEANQKIGQQIYDELKKKYIRLDEQFDWISWLASAPPNADLKKVPENMVSPFSKDVILQKVIQIQNLGHGKSKPIRIQFKALKNKRSVNVYIIRKLITNYKSQFRTESATANFFKDCKLLDQQITYSIVHLAKYCLLVEHIEHKATLDFLLNNNIEASQLKKMTNVMEIMKNNKISVMSFAYDKKEFQLNYKLYQFFFSSSSTIIKSWWEKYRNFLKTYAQWCFLGYVVGLGDRHTNNILVTEQGRVIHIDFEYIFDSGKFLPFPEWVPFRLTRGLLSQVCSIEPYGLLYSQFIKTAIRYKDKKRQIWHAQSHFSFMKKKDMSNQINKRAYLKNRPFEEAELLFKRSSSKMLLRDMYYGWGSFK